MLNEKYLQMALDKVPHKCLLINMLSRRVEQLNNGAKAQVDEDSLSNTNIALKEIATEKIWVTFLNEDDIGTTGVQDEIVKVKVKKNK